MIACCLQLGQEVIQQKKTRQSVISREEFQKILKQVPLNLSCCIGWPKFFVEGHSDTVTARKIVLDVDRTLCEHMNDHNDFFDFVKATKLNEELVTKSQVC